MATDYDAPRKTDEESEDSIEELKTRRNDKNSGKVDEDEVEAAETFELPGADLSHRKLTVRVLPRQADEFTCMSCFLVKHREPDREGEGRQDLLRRLRRLTARVAPPPRQAKKNAAVPIGTAAWCGLATKTRGRCACSAADGG